MSRYNGATQLLPVDLGHYFHICGILGVGVTFAFTISCSVTTSSWFLLRGTTVSQRVPKDKKSRFSDSLLTWIISVSIAAYSDVFHSIQAVSKKSKPEGHHIDEAPNTKEEITDAVLNDLTPLYLFPRTERRIPHEPRALSLQLIERKRSTWSCQCQLHRLNFLHLQCNSDKDVDLPDLETHKASCR